MELYLISGFLGSGKTTTIIALCKTLMKQGKKVGVVTNDQGKYLVDTAFMKARDIPAVDVQSGCFCSNYQDLVEQLEELKETVDPDVVFAESIGSAGNLVGTVMKPLIDGSEFKPTLLAAVVDARLLLRIIRNEFLPFSDSVNATFKNQLIESDALIINKLDMLDSTAYRELITGIEPIFGSKAYTCQSVFKDEDIEKTRSFLKEQKRMAQEDDLFDPDLHQKALERLKWTEEVHELHKDKNVRDDIEKIILGLLKKTEDEHYTVAHIKVLIKSTDKVLKLSITGLDKDSWLNDLKDFEAKNATLIINSRIQS